MASLYYAEPFVAFLVLAGWMRIRRGRGVLSGWILIGAAGLFKNEGSVLCLVCWAALRLTDGRRTAPLRGLLAALVLPTVASGMGIFILKGFFDALPRELYEAAAIDGASEWTVFRKITLPMTTPILAVNALGDRQLRQRFAP